MSTYLPTIRETESKKLENITKKRTEMRKWGLYRYPTPTKRIKSVGKLKEAIDEFFEEHPLDVEKASQLPTPTELAMYLGYPSQQALYNEVNNPVDPRYSAVLAQSLDMIKDALLKRQMDIAEIGKRWEGIDAALSRMERIEERTMPVTDSKSSIAIQINMNAQQKTRQLIDESVSSLIAGLADSNLRNATEAEVEEPDDIS